jgi:TRAP-type mannitol/chloroaromatic compound transport system substrate-binding protein
MIEEDPTAARIYESWSAFLEKSIPNQRITEQAFLATRK